LGSFAVTADEALLEDGGVGPGAFFCLRSENTDVVTDTTYALSPHFLVFVADDGEVKLNFTHSRRFLDLIKKLALGRSQPDADAHRRFEDHTSGGADMAHYRTLLERAVGAVSGRAEEKGVESLFRAGGTALSRDSHRGIDDFEIVAFVAVLSANGG
jgi:hypothetical protein